jgi:hypothetical protein
MYARRAFSGFIGCEPAHLEQMVARDGPSARMFVPRPNARARCRKSGSEIRPDSV